MESEKTEKFKYKNYMLILLTFVAAFNYLDRTLLTLLVEPIKQDLQLSDSQIGFLHGFAFTLFYAVAGVPIARWADRGNRNVIVSVTVALWSSMVALSALAGNFAQLLLMRIGVAVGEAGCAPPAQSLISDYFDRAERPSAMAIYWMCGPISAIVAYLGGGWLAAVVGWRTTFVVVGLAGVAMAILVKLTLREPRTQQKVASGVDQPPLKDVLATLWKQKTFRHVGIAFCIAYFFGNGIGLWIPAFFMRSHGMEIGELGGWLALVWGGCGLLGTYFGGFLATRYAAGREGVQMHAVAAILTVCSILFFFCFLSNNRSIALTLMALFSFLFAMLLGPVFSALQSLVCENMRSSSLAVIYLVSNLVGAGLGPLTVGVSSDLLELVFGHESLRYALLAFTPGYLLCAYFFWKASKTIDSDISSIRLQIRSGDIDHSSLKRKQLPIANEDWDFSRS